MMPEGPDAQGVSFANPTHPFHSFSFLCLYLTKGTEHINLKIYIIIIIFIINIQIKQ